LSLFTPENIHFKDHVSQVKFLFIWRLSLGLCFIFFALSILFWFEDTSAWLTYLITLIVISGSLLYLNYSKNEIPAFMILVYGGSIIIHLDLNTVLDSSHFGNFSWMGVLILLGFFGLGIIQGFIVLTVNLLATLYFTLFTMHEHFEVLKQAEPLNKYVIAIEFTCTMFITGYIVYLFITAQRFAEKKLILANKELGENYTLIQRKNEEKTVLVKEIHHRVKNNLQIITSLLRLQMGEIKNEEARAHFGEAINRVMVMSSIHQKLYQGEDITQFVLSEYIEELAKELRQFFAQSLPVNIKINSEYEHVDLKTVVPIGLIINELLSNSFKYAFEGKDSGEIIINVIDKKDDFEIFYSDNGLWKVSDHEENGFGLELIDILTEQLSGTKTLVTNEEGTNYSFIFKKDDA